ncbi:MAG: glycogen debranching enzyme family protein, partial [Chloroflexi bacterium]|nr:glycogen debranching enzyme family protein [Chloroflexota bacterium]
MIVIPREICRDLPRALAREWIVTNGIGGYASSTITGANTRRYHGLLIAALAPPAARVVLLSKIDEEVQIGGLTYRLGTNQYENGTIHPDGYLYLERVELDGMLPTFFYQAPNFALTKTIWMEHGANTTHIHYQLARESAPIQLTLLPLCTHKNFHTELRGAAEWRFAVAACGGELEINAFEGATPYRLLFPPRVQFVPLDLWYWRFLHAREQDRGYDAVEDLFLPGLLRVNLRGGETLTITATTDARGIGNSVARSRARARTRQKLLARRAQDDVEKQLRVAADQFIIHRADEKENRARVLAGYPWFDERTRATLIALEGLLIVTRRYTEAKEILRAYAAEIENG